MDKDFIIDYDDEGMPEVEYVFHDVIDIQEELNKRIGLFDFPKSIQIKILSKAAISALITVLFIVLMIMNHSFSFKMIMILIVVDVIMALNIRYIYQSILYDNYRVFEGVVLSVDKKGFRGTMKYKYVIVYNEEKDKYLSFNYSNERTKLREGFDVRVYLSSDEPVVMRDGIMHVDNYFSVTVGHGNDFDTKSDKTLTIDEYLN